jgi:hypothetical protein
MIQYEQPVLQQRLTNRYLLCAPVSRFQQTAIEQLNGKQRGGPRWRVVLANNLLFDTAGLEALHQTITAYQGIASRLEFKLRLPHEAVRDYYSHNIAVDQNNDISLPVTATLIDPVNEQTETLVVTPKALTTEINFPHALCPPDRNSTPLALLLPYSCDHDLLFANQIAIFSQLNRCAPRSYGALLRGVIDRRKLPLPRRVALSWRNIGQDTEIHPTAVVEGSVIGKGCRIGAHCVVRYSVLGDNVQLHDGAKAEFSVIGDGAWLMHDMVLYRCLVEKEVFLIHGPYQFSYFMNNSAAFACIMMDYRPDAKPIRINTEHGLRQYQGRFLGALLEETAKVFGGTLTAPGITIPASREVCAQSEHVTRPKDLHLPHDGDLS